MPVIANIDSIQIKIYFEDHQPPHFHIWYAEFRGIMTIETLSIMQSDIPAKQLKKARDWAEINQQFLRDKWNEFC